MMSMGPLGNALAMLRQSSAELVAEGTTLARRAAIPGVLSLFLTWAAFALEAQLGSNTSGLVANLVLQLPSYIVMLRFVVITERRRIQHASATSPITLSLLRNALFVLSMMAIAMPLLFFFGAFVVGYLYLDNRVIFAVWALGGFFVWCIVASTVALSLPALAAGHDSTVRRAARLSKGRRIRLALVIGAATLLCVGFHWGVGISTPSASADSGPRLLQLAQWLVVTVAEYLLSTVVGRVLSLYYLERLPTE
jgi:hypothetical protein